MGQLGRMGNHSVVGFGVTDANGAEAHLTEQGAEPVQIPFPGGFRRYQNHTGAVEQLRKGALIARSGQSGHGMAAGIPYAMSGGQGRHRLFHGFLDAHQIHNSRPRLHGGNDPLQKGDSSPWIQHRNQQITPGQNFIIGNAVDGPVRQSLLRHGPGPVPAIHQTVRMLFKRFCHGAADEAQSCYHYQLFHCHRFLCYRVLNG